VAKGLKSKKDKEKREMNIIRRNMVLAGLLSSAVLFLPLVSQGADASTSGQKSLSSTLNIYVFPSAGQDAAQQSQDENECYNWAVQNSGVDPFALQQQSSQQQQQTEQAKAQVAQSGSGAGAKGALGGAAAGAVIGEIASDDAGKGAAIGAAVGAVGARRKAAAGKEQANQQLDAQAQQAQQVSAEQMNNFKKAFGVCLEAKQYMVK
jgi:hypothetical protein